MKNRIAAFVALQIYFISSLLSFTIWEIGIAGVVHAVIYFGCWILGLTVLLALVLRQIDSNRRPRITILCLVLLSLPLFGVWLQVFNLKPRWIEYVIVLMFPAAGYGYYLLCSIHAKKMQSLVLCLCTVALFSHSSSLLENSNDSFDEYSNIRLKRKPNIHVIMFDSLTTSDYTREFLSMNNPAAEYIAELDDSIFGGKRGFVEATTTRKSWSTIFHLGTSSAKSVGVFSGSRNSPLVSLLRANGYKTQTGYATRYLGWKKGDYIDFYHLDQFNWANFKTIVCEQKLLGYCSRFSENIYGFVKYILNFNDRGNTTPILWEDYVIEKIREFENNENSPVFSAFHVYAPGHWFNGASMNPQTFEKFRDLYSSGSLRVLRAMRKINELRLEFNESIFIVSGDHGPFLTSGYDSVDDQRFLTLDSHHVALTLLNQSKLCNFERNWLQEQEILTATRLLVASLSCDGDLNQKLLQNLPHNSNWVKYGLTLGTKTQE